MIQRIRMWLSGFIGARAAHAPDTRSPDLELIRRIRARRLTYLPEPRLARLAHACRTIEASGIPGIVVEAGCALGGSAILLASTKRPERPFHVYDVFGMIPSPTKEDTPDGHQRYQKIAAGRSKGIQGDQYYGYVGDLLGVVHSNLASFGIDIERQTVTLIKGLVQDTLKINEPVALAHVDVDWYAPVMTCLSRIFPNLAVGGCIILDDYHSWGGCRKAADEYLREVAGQFELDDASGSLKITRSRPAYPGSPA